MTEEEVILNEKKKVEVAAKAAEDAKKAAAAGGGSDQANQNFQSTPTNYPTSKRGIVLLGLYLVLTLALSVFLLFSLMTAKDISKTGKTEDKAETTENVNTNTNVNNNQNTDTNVNTNNTNQNTNANSNVNGGNVGGANTNGGNTNGKPPTNGTTGNSSMGNSNKTPTPTPTPLKQTFYKHDIPREVSARIFGDLTADSFVFLVVLFAGMMGAIIRGIHSFFKHLGLGDFSFKWTWFYLLLPFSGAALSVVIYLVIRGGFYTSSYGEGLSLNVFSFAALAALTGLFSDNALEKLRQVARVLLADVPPKIPNAKEVMDKKDAVNKGNQ